MDPFTQRMIERAKERRAKHAGKIQDRGEPTLKRTPLQETNQTVLEVTTKVTFAKSPVKEVISPKIKSGISQSESPKKTNIPKEEEGDAHVVEDPAPIQNSCLRDVSKSRLKRLGALYSDTQLSSPIQRTESKFCADSTSDSENENTISHCHTSRTPRPSAAGRSRRLALLANQINEWEDEPRSKTSKGEESKIRETSQSSIKQSNSSSPSKRLTPPLTSMETGPSSSKNSLNKRDIDITKVYSTKENTSKKRQAPQPPPLPAIVSLNKKESPIKQRVESKKTFSSKENSHKRQASTDPVPTTSEVTNKKTLWDKRIIESLESQGYQRSVSNSKLVFDYNNKQKEQSDPPKILEIRAKLKPQKNSPEKKIVPLNPKTNSSSSGSVMQKAALFEASSPIKKPNRDPSELPLSERLALFEKGGNGKNAPPPLIPKAAFAMNIPAAKSSASKVPQETRPKPSAPPMSEEETPVFKKEIIAKHPGPSIPEVISDPHETWINSQTKSNSERLVESQRQERQRELQALKERWNGHRHLVGCSPQAPAPAPPPPPPLEQKTEEIPRSLSSSSIKRIRVSPPKPGMLYPNLSDIEATTTDTDQEPKESQDNLSFESSNMESSFEDSSQDLGDTSFGREIIKAATSGRESIKINEPGSESSDESHPDNIMRDFDGYLDTALDQVDSDEENEPTPPKRGRSSHSKSSLTAHSNSFEYQQTENLPEVVEDTSGHVVPLVHTVSFYRRQQQKQTGNTNIRQIVRSSPSTSTETVREETQTVDPEIVRARISRLLDEISKQQAIISQTSQALNFCESTFEFSGSKEQLEAERLLLLATHRRQAFLNEVQRLRVEGGTGPLGGEGSGELILSSISVTLNRDFLRQMANDDLCQYLVCLARCGDQVQATSALEASISALGKDARLQFPGSPLKLVALPTDFIVALEVYCYKVRKEILPEEIKYHINQKECQKNRLTPRKLKSNPESRLTKPPPQSPAGPNAVRIPNFQLAGHVMFSLRETHRTQFTLTKVAAPYASPLEGSLQIQMSCTLALTVSHSGFLTVFQEVGGFGAWHRRWARLDGDKLLFWKYPDDEKHKIPMQTISLGDPSGTPIGPVSRDKCARPNTFLVETSAISQLLSADTREEREEWCRHLNKSLGLVRAWGGVNQNH